MPRDEGGGLAGRLLPTLEPSVPRGRGGCRGLLTSLRGRFYGPIVVVRVRACAPSAVPSGGAALLRRQHFDCSRRGKRSAAGQVALRGSRGYCVRGGQRCTHACTHVCTHACMRAAAVPSQRCRLAAGGAERRRPTHHTPAQRTPNTTRGSNPLPACSARPSGRDTSPHVPCLPSGPSRDFACLPQQRALHRECEPAPGCDAPARRRLSACLDVISGGTRR